MGKIQCADMLKVEKMLQFINSIKSGFNVIVPHERREFVQLQFNLNKSAVEQFSTGYIFTIHGWPVSVWG